MKRLLTALHVGQRRYILLFSALTFVFSPLQKSHSNHPLPLQDSHITPESTFKIKGLSQVRATALKTEFVIAHSGHHKILLDVMKNQEGTRNMSRRATKI